MLLRPEDQRMCCLGFVAQQCGFTKKQLSEISDLHGLCMMGETSSPLVTKISELDLVSCDWGTLQNALITINDEFEGTPSKRLRKLNGVCRRYKAKFRFAFKN